MAKIRVAIVGSGGIARRHALALEKNEHAQLEAVVDIREEIRDAFCERWGGKPFARLDDCLDHVDAVYVLTPPSVRRDLALQALAADKHLFCEKPLASTEEDALAIAKAAAERPVVSMMGLNMRYRTGFSRLQETVSSGKLGKPYHFWRQRFSRGPGASGTIVDRNWRTDPNFVCGMTVESFSHDVDMLRWVMQDEVATLSAIVYGTVPELPAFDNNAHVMIKMRRGASAVISASWSSRIGFNTCGVLGEKGTAFLSGAAEGNNGAWCSHEFHFRTDQDEFETVELIRDDLDDASYRLETDDFVNAIRMGTTPKASIADGYETLRISAAALQAAQGNSVVEISQEYPEIH